MKRSRSQEAPQLFRKNLRKAETLSRLIIYCDGRFSLAKAPPGDHRTSAHSREFTIDAGKRPPQLGCSEASFAELLDHKLLKRGVLERSGRHQANRARSRPFYGDAGLPSACCSAGGGAAQADFDAGTGGHQRPARRAVAQVWKPRPAAATPQRQFARGLGGTAGRAPIAASARWSAG